jgi:hypothetical protein
VVVDACSGLLQPLPLKVATCSAKHAIHRLFIVLTLEFWFWVPAWTLWPG